MGWVNEPWNKFYCYAKARCLKGMYKIIGIDFNMTKDDFKQLWFRDKAHEMKNPSIDRINTLEGYSFSNCRFIEMLANRKRPRRKSRSSRCKFKGVYYQKDHKKYRSVIIKDGKDYHLGYFKTEEEAATAYNQALFKLFPNETIELNKV